VALTEYCAKDFRNGNGAYSPPPSVAMSGSQHYEEQRLVNRRVLLERAGVADESKMKRQNSHQKRTRGASTSSYSVDRLSLSSHGSNGSNYDSPRAAAAGLLVRPSPPLTPKSQRRLSHQQHAPGDLPDVPPATAYGNYDIPRSLIQQQVRNWGKTVEDGFLMNDSMNRIPRHFTTRPGI